MAPQWTPDDETFMSVALSLAAGQLGKTGVNPAVGCVIVKDGVILGQGATDSGGRPHGEAMALSAIIGGPSLARGATAYVTLEPCAHISARGPHCAGALIDAGITRLVCCLQDPDPRTAGAGFELLRKAGVQVDIGLLVEQGKAQIGEFAARF